LGGHCLWTGIEKVSISIFHFASLDEHLYWTGSHAPPIR
jgi:hypothetical protein